MGAGEVKVAEEEAGGEVLEKVEQGEGDAGVRGDEEGGEEAGGEDDGEEDGAAETRIAEGEDGGEQGGEEVELISISNDQAGGLMMENFP